MSEFDKIIGYDGVKIELQQICDMIHNPNVYEKLGAKMSKGMLIHGVPGVGKSLMAISFMKESGRKYYTIRRNKHDGNFIDEIKKIFSEAAKNAPSIILLDDMDKFVVEKKGQKEYVAIQACIDEVRNSDVYVIATANSLQGIPDSLLRAGRFDRKIRVGIPELEDSIKIIGHYMKTKPFVDDIDIDDLAKMLYKSSCAELETLLNEAAIYAGFERNSKITTEHIVKAELRYKYNADNSFIEDKNTAKEAEKIAYHEAGHIVVCEVLQPNSIGIAAILGRKYGIRGFVKRCRTFDNENYDILMQIGGKASVELNYGGVDFGARDDIDNAIEEIRYRVVNLAACGITNCKINSFNNTPTSQQLLSRTENIVHNEFQRYMNEAKEILINNKDFLDAIVKALLEKGILLNSDINKIRESCKVTYTS